MTLALLDLARPGVREAALAEVERDFAADRLYPSKRFNEHGTRVWPGLLQDALRSGTADTLEVALRKEGVFVTHEESKSKNGKVFVKAVPHDAARTLAEGEFNRFYIRGLCQVAIKNAAKLVIYRAKVVSSPRPESEAAIGRFVDANTLLSDLRTHIGVDTALGVPPGPNSGLSVHLQEA